MKQCFKYHDGAMRLLCEPQEILYNPFWVESRETPFRNNTWYRASNNRISHKYVAREWGEAKSISQQEHMFKIITAWGPLILFFFEWKTKAQRLWTVKFITILVTYLKQKQDS